MLEGEAEEGKEVRKEGGNGGGGRGGQRGLRNGSYRESGGTSRELGGRILDRSGSLSYMRKASTRPKSFPSSPFPFSHLSSLPFQLSEAERRQLRSSLPSADEYFAVSIEEKGRREWFSHTCKFTKHVLRVINDIRRCVPSLPSPPPSFPPSLLPSLPPGLRPPPSGPILQWPCESFVT